MPLWHIFIFFIFIFFYFYVSKPEHHVRHTEGRNSLHNVTLGGYNLDKIGRDTILYNLNIDPDAENYNSLLVR
jgi:hypothetical protein